MIEVRELTKSYGDKLALDHVSFSIDSGQVVGLLGLNGAGKSTTMNILTGYISATDGRVTIDGHDIVSESKAAKKVIGYMPEQPAFYPELRVDEHLNFICDLKGVTKNRAEREAHIADICERVGITHMRRRMVRNLSKGYRQRVGFAQALIGHPKVIILDEPTVGLDPSQIVEIRKLIKESGRDNTVIVSSHILSEIQAICNRIIVLNAGRIVADGSPDQLSSQLNSTNRIRVRVRGDADRAKDILGNVKDVRAVRKIAQSEPGTTDFAVTGKEGSDIRADIFRAMAKADLPLLAVSGMDLSLEDVFLNIVEESEPKKNEGKKKGGKRA